MVFKGIQFNRYFTSENSASTYSNQETHFAQGSSSFRKKSMPEANKWIVVPESEFIDGDWDERFHVHPAYEH